VTLGVQRSWVQTQWRAPEIPASPLPLGLTWALRQQIVSQLRCCVPNKNKKNKLVGHDDHYNASFIFLAST